MEIREETLVVLLNRTWSYMDEGPVLLPDGSPVMIGNEPVMSYLWEVIDVPEDIRLRTQRCNIFEEWIDILRCKVRKIGIAGDVFCLYDVRRSSKEGLPIVDRRGYNGSMNILSRVGEVLVNISKGSVQ